MTLAGIAGPVAAADPSEDHARACRRRVPGADVRRGTGEALPFEDGMFDAVLSQPLDDAPTAAGEMHRVAAPDGVAAACVWDFGDGMPLLDAYWAAAAHGARTGAVCS
jgi:ubiquinone/menaquinone biosynthesis C-methylase UbiE